MGVKDPGWGEQCEEMAVKKSVVTRQCGLCTDVCHTPVRKLQDRGESFSITEHHTAATPSCGKLGI